MGSVLHVCVCYFHRKVGDGIIISYHSTINKIVLLAKVSTTSYSVTRRNSVVRAGNSGSDLPVNDLHYAENTSADHVGQSCYSLP